MFNTTANEIAGEVARQTEEIVLSQMNILLQDGVLVIESTEPVLTVHQELMTGKTILKMDKAVRLTYKGAEVVAALKKENQELKNRLAALRDALNIQVSYNDEN